MSWLNGWVFCFQDPIVGIATWFSSIYTPSHIYIPGTILFKFFLTLISLFSSIYTLPHIHIPGSIPFKFFLTLKSSFSFIYTLSHIRIPGSIPFKFFLTLISLFSSIYTLPHIYIPGSIPFKLFLTLISLFSSIYTLSHIHIPGSIPFKFFLTLTLFSSIYTLPHIHIPGSIPFKILSYTHVQYPYSLLCILFPTFIFPVLLNFNSSLHSYRSSSIYTLHHNLVIFFSFIYKLPYIHILDFFSSFMLSSHPIFHLHSSSHSHSWHCSIYILNHP